MKNKIITTMAILWATLITLLVMDNHRAKIDGETAQFNRKPPMHRQHPKHKRPPLTEEKMQKNAEKIKKDLSLDIEQSKKIDSLFTKHFKEIEAKMKLEKENKKRENKLRKEQKENFENSIKALLTDEQKATFEKIIKEQKNKRPKKGCQEKKPRKKEQSNTK